MPIYEYNGQHYDIDTADPEEAKTKILTHLGESAPTPAAEKSAGDYVKDFGRGLASAVDTGANMVTGLGSYVGYPVGRAFGLNPQEATAAANRVGAPLQNPVGRAFGIENDPAYQNSAANKIVGGIGQGISSVAQPISNATGLPQQDVEHMLGTGLIAAGPAIPKVAGAVGRGASAIGEGVKNVGGAASDVAQGAYHGFTNTAVRPGVAPKPWQTPSARQPIGDTYVTPESLQAWRAGEIPASDLTHRPTTDLPANALKQTQGMVPYQGQQWRALGEQIGSSYRDPVKLMAEAAGDLAFGGVPTAARLALKGYGLYQGQRAFNQLGQAGFTPITPAEHAAIQQGGMHPNVAAVKPVAPTAPGGLPLNAQQQSFNFNDQPRPEFSLQPPPGTTSGNDIQQTIQQIAADKVIKATPTAEQQAMLDQIRARKNAGNQPSAPVAPETAPMPAAPAVTETPVKPEFTPPASWMATPGYRPPKVDQLKEKLAATTTPEDIAANTAATEAYNQLSKTEKAAQTRAERGTGKKKTMETDLENELKIMADHNPKVSDDRKTLTYYGQENFESHPNALPREFNGKNEPDWKRQNLHYDENENVIGVSWESVGAKKSPAYKFVEDLKSDNNGVLYKKEAGGEWEEVQPIKKTTAKKAPSTLPDLIVLGKDIPLSAREAKKLISSAESLGKQYDISYKTPDGIVSELNRKVKFKPDPTITLNHIKMMPDNSIIATGIDTNGNSVTVNVDPAGKHTISRVGETAKKAPPGVSNMISGDAASTFNKLKLPQGASELEQKAASMPQEHRSRLISVLKDQLNNPKIDTAAKDLIQAQISMMEKYNIK